MVEKRDQAREIRTSCLLYSHVLSLLPKEQRIAGAHTVAVKNERSKVAILFYCREEKPKKRRRSQDGEEPASMPLSNPYLPCINR